ncbi:MAG: hypothetical protein ACI4CX_02525 [Candidatus Weimeria sp.]
MSKRKSVPNEIDDEFLAQVDFLRDDYDKALETIEQQKDDIRQLIAILVKEDIPIPEDLADRYIRKTSDSDPIGEELPFD